MRRREFITLLGGAAAWPLAARAEQSERVRRVGAFIAGTAETDPQSLPKTVWDFARLADNGNSGLVLL